MTELGSARQLLLWLRPEKVSLPAKLEGTRHQIIWKLPIYNTIWHMLQNAMYAGAYVFGKTESRTRSDWIRAANAVRNISGLLAFC